MSRVFGLFPDERSEPATADDVQRAREFFEAHPDRRSRKAFFRDRKGNVVGLSQNPHSFCLLGAIGMAVAKRNDADGIDLEPFFAALAKLKGRDIDDDDDKAVLRDLITDQNDYGSIEGVIAILRDVETQMRADETAIAATKGGA